ncbi:MAG: EutN/CcmL family microcompartment protein [Pirellulales bacterium]
MQLGVVVGTATSTVKHPTLTGWKMLVVQVYGADGRTPDGEPLIAIDALGAGIGASVVLSSDGKGTRELVKSDNTPVRYSVVGIRD